MSLLPEPSASQKLSVVLHTAKGERTVAGAKMPSPLAKLKAARRLPKRLRTSGEAPDGDIARMREEASARYERGESSSSTLHSCHQRTSKSWADIHPGRWANNQWSWDDTWTTSWCDVHGWTQDEQAGWTHSWRSDTYPSSDGWDSAQAPEATPDRKNDRPLPPKPPTPRRQRQEQLRKPGAPRLWPPLSPSHRTPEIAEEGPLRDPTQLSTLQVG